jgi:hypothetical protein
MKTRKPNIVYRLYRKYITNRNPIVPDELSGHLILLAKGHYKRTDNSVNDVSKFMRNWSGMSDDYNYSKLHIYKIVLETFTKYVSKYELYNWLEKFYDYHGIYRENLPVENAIDVMLSALSLVKIRDIDLSTLTDYGLVFKLPELKNYCEATK